MKSFIFLIILTFSTYLYADINSCPGKTVASMDEIVSNQSTTLTGYVDKNGDRYDYYTFQINTAGTLSYNYSSDRKTDFYISNSACNDNKVLNKGYSESGNITITSGDVVYIKIKGEDTHNDNYSVGLTFTASADPQVPPTFSGTISDQTTFYLSSFSFDTSTYFEQTNEDTITYGSSSTLPDGVTLDANTGILSGTPSTIATYSNITITATDNDGNTTSNSFSIDVLPIQVGFDSATYNISEDIYSADDAVQILSVNVVLSNAAPFDISVNYATSDGSAVSTSDYDEASGTLIIPAGSTSGTIYINIRHDIAVELEESFNLTLSSAQPSDGTVEIATNPTEIIILEQTQVAECFGDDFNSALDSGWRLLYSQNGTGGAIFTPAAYNGRLRMTPAQNEISTAVTKDYRFPAASNLITIVFDQFAYGSTDGWSSNGADGIGVILYDSNVGDSPTPGAFGGSLGYAPKSAALSDATVDINGFLGGWLGLGLDEYGNFSNPTEGRTGGPGFRSNAVSIRGDGSGMSGYEYLQGTNSLSPALSSSGSSDYSGGRFRMMVDSRDTSHLYITLERDATRDGTYESTIINKFDAKDPSYSQGTTPEYIRIAITSSTGGANNIHEIDDLHVYGVCGVYEVPAGESVVSEADIVNNFNLSNYNSGTKYITTKVSNKTETITGVHLDSGNNASTFTSTDNNLVFRIIPYLSDSTCSTQEILYDTNGNPAIIKITNGNASGDIDIVMPAKATKDSRFAIAALDFNEVYTNNPDSCLLNASLDGNLQGISQCMNSSSKYEATFGTETYNRCVVGNGAPCSSNNGGRSCGQEQNTGGGLTTDEINSCGYNPIYASDYGCLMCTMGAELSCSSDNFAIRPDKFILASSASQYPDLLRSGENYNMSITAYDYGISSGVDTTNDYTITNAENNISIIAYKKFYKTGLEDTSALMGGAMSWGSNSFNMQGGISISGLSNEVAGFNFSDVGKVTVRVQDTTWASVDTNNPNDATPHDCSSSGAWICGDMNATFIPHHFSFVDLNITNNNGNPGTFTYISNLNPSDSSTFGMSARVNTKVEARNKNDGITSNFRTGSNFYENPVTVDMNITDTLNGDANTTIINNQLLVFGQDNSDANGTRTITWDETDTAKVLRFNFPRTVSNALNPFDVNGSELNVTISSDYTGTAPEGSATIVDDDSGKATASGGATILYGRTHATRQIFDSDSGTVPIYFEVYCNATDSVGNSCNKSLLPNGTDSNSTDDPRWFVNTSHTSSSGVAGSVAQKGGLSFVTATNATLSNPAQTQLNYTASSTRGYPYKTTMQNSASSWLIYNKYNSSATTNEFDVEFVGSGDWVGTHETNTTTIKTGAQRTNRRLMW